MASRLHRLLLPLQPSLTRVVPRDHRQTAGAFRRRQLITGVVVLVGAGVLGWSLRIEHGSSTFYLATFLLAAVWAVGAFASGPLYLGRIDTGLPGTEDAPLRRPIVHPLLLGVGLSVVFVLGGLVIREIDWLGAYVRDVLDYANQGSAPVLLAVTLVNGIAEELFFRGAVYAALPKHPVLWSTVIYVIATLATGNVMLGFAAIVVGTVVGLQRRASGGILAPIITHCVWSSTMLFALPAIFNS